MSSATIRKPSASKASKIIPSTLYLAVEVDVCGKLKRFGVASTSLQEANDAADEIRHNLDDLDAYPRLVAVALTDKQRRIIQDAVCGK